MNNQQLLNDTIRQLEQLKSKAGAKTKRKATHIQDKIRKHINPEKNPEIPQMIVLIEGGIIQDIKATRGDIDITVIDKDLDSEPTHFVQKKPIDELIMDRSHAIEQVVGTKAYLNLNHKVA